MKKLSIIIPVYNEEKTVGKLLNKLFSTKIPVSRIEYIIVDDGSIDKTALQIEKQLKGKTKSIKFIRHKKNQGKGAAIKTGLKKATGDYIVIQDADLEYNPRDIAKLVEKIAKGNDVVYGTRLNRLPNFSRDERTPVFFLHYVGNKLLSLVTSILYFNWVSDMECCYKMFPREALRDVHLRAKSFDFEPEITAKLLKKRYKFSEVAISTNPRGYDEGKKIHALTDGSIALWTLIKYRFVE